MLKRVKNGQREKIMGPGTSMGSKEYKIVGLVGNVAIKKSLIVHQKQKYPKFEGIFWGQKLDLQPKKGVVAHLG